MSLLAAARTRAAFPQIFFGQVLEILVFIIDPQAQPDYISSGYQRSALEQSSDDDT